MAHLDIQAAAGGIGRGNQGGIQLINRQRIEAAEVLLG